MLRRRGIGRVGRPSLVGTMARTAVVAGTASAVAGGVSRHQQNKADQKAEAQAYEQQEQAAAYAPPPQPVYQAPPPAAPAAPATLGPDAIKELQQLAELHSSGVLTDEEFNAQKAKLLGS